jgi:carboxypeptidase Taq
MREYLGLEVPDDTRGVLQDVHWSHGYVGSFPTYTVGNIMSSQLFRKAGKIPEITHGLQEGDYQPLKNWLVENVYRHGRSSTPKETLLRVTGDTLNAEHYIADLTEKVEMLICNQ